MNRFFKMIVTVAAMAFFVGVFAPAESRAQGILNTILTRMDNLNKALASLKSDLKMIKHNPQLNENETYEGTIMFLSKTPRRPRYARIDWLKPRVESIAVIGDSFQSYVPARQLLTTGKATNATRGVPGALGLLSMSKAQLQETYVIDYVGQEQITGAVQTWHLRLTPRKAGLYKSSDLWVDGDGLPRQVMDTERNDNTTTLLLSGPRQNEKVDPGAFKIDFPKGTKAVKL